MGQASGVSTTSGGTASLPESLKKPAARLRVLAACQLVFKVIKYRRTFCIKKANSFGEGTMKTRLTDGAKLFLFLIFAAFVMACIGLSETASSSLRKSFEPEPAGSALGFPCHRVADLLSSECEERDREVLRLGDEIRLLLRRARERQRDAARYRVQRYSGHGPMVSRPEPVCNGRRVFSSIIDA